MPSDRSSNNMTNRSGESFQNISEIPRSSIKSREQGSTASIKKHPQSLHKDYSLQKASPPKKETQNTSQLSNQQQN